MMDGLPSWVTSLLLMDGVPSWLWHENYEREKDGTLLISVSLYLSKTRKPSAMRDVTAPEIARGVPLPVYMNFYNFNSRCV